jgi:hypothetical protein
MKYYSVRIFTALLVMGSFEGGFLARVEYGTWIGWMVFIVMMLTGIKLHYVAAMLGKISFEVKPL